MPYGITQCYLPPGRGDIPAFTPAKADTRFSDPRGMQGWVDPGGWLEYRTSIYCNKTQLVTTVSIQIDGNTSQAVQSRCTVVRPMQKINRKMGNSTPCEIVTPENIILKLCIRDYIGEMTHHTNFGFNRCSGGFSPNRRNITTLWLVIRVWNSSEEFRQY